MILKAFLIFVLIMWIVRRYFGARILQAFLGFLGRKMEQQVRKQTGQAEETVPKKEGEIRILRPEKKGAEGFSDFEELD